MASIQLGHAPVLGTGSLVGYRGLFLDDQGIGDEENPADRDTGFLFVPGRDPLVLHASNAGVG